MPWVALIAAGVSAYGAYNQNKNAKKAIGGTNQLAGIQANTASTIAPYISDFYSRAKSSFDPAFSFYNSLASGDRNKAMGVLAPQLNAIGTKYRTIANTAGELNPRGGAGAGYQTDLAYRSGDEQQNLLNQARFQGVQGLAGLAGTAGALGSGAGGVVTGAANSGGSLFGSGFNMGNVNAGDMAGNYDSIAQAIMQAYSKYKNPASPSTSGAYDPFGVSGND